MLVIIVHEPTKRHLALLKEIMRYVAATVNSNRFYHCSVQAMPTTFRAHVDADLGGRKKSESELLAE